MPPILASILTIAFIVFLFRRDIRRKPNVTGAIWLPTLWMFIIASRPCSWWLNLLGLPVFGAAAVEEGSPVDAFVFFVLIAAGLTVLSRRQVKWNQVLRDNAWLAVFILYCFLAVFWSDFPFVSFKRWIKILGHPIMILVLFTEPNLEEALITTMKRCAYVLFPVSILWIKYYPALGRSASEWGGMSTSGIAGNKNALGAICLLWGLFFFWHFLKALRLEKGTARRDELRLTGGLLFMVAYCLWKAHSATSLLSLVLGLATILFLGLRFVNVRMVGSYLIIGILILVVLQTTSNFYSTVAQTTGHDETIEGRADLWATLLETDTQPIFGAGFESFWLGDRLQRIWEKYWWRPTQAHNGYLEIYLNLGIVGFVILAVNIIGAFRNCRESLLRNLDWGRLKMGYLLAILAHNWTEAGFKGLSTMFLFFFLIAVKYPNGRISSIVSSTRVRRSEELADIAGEGSRGW